MRYFQEAERIGAVVSAMPRRTHARNPSRSKLVYIRADTIMGPAYSAVIVHVSGRHASS